MKLVGFALLLLVIGSHAFTFPGLEFGITQPGIERIRDRVLPVLMRALKKMHLNELDGTYHVPVVGDIDWKITNLVVTAAGYLDSSIKIDDGAAVNLAIKGISFSITYDWEFTQKDHAKLHDKGSASVDVKDAEFGVGFAVKSVERRVKLFVSVTSTIIENLEVHVTSTKYKWLYEVLDWIFHNKFVKEFKAECRSLLLSFLQDMADKATKDLPLVIVLDPENDIVFDDGAAAPPVTANNAIFLRSLGEASDEKKPLPPCPFPHVVLPMTCPKDSMLVMFFDVYAFNSALWTYFEDQLLHRFVTDAEVPQHSLFRLNTDWFSVIMPELFYKYPNAPMRLLYNSTASPLVRVKGDSHMHMLGEIVFQAKKGGNWDTVFTLSAYTSALLHINDVTGPTVTAKMDEVELDVKLVASRVGKVPLNLFSSHLTTIANKVLLPIINKHLDDGLTLPFPLGVSLYDTHLELSQEGYFWIATKFDFDPSKIIPDI